MPTKSQLQNAINSKDGVIYQQSDRIEELEHKIAVTERNKNSKFIQVSKDPGIPYLLIGLLNPEGKVYFTLAALANYQNMVQVSNATLSEILEMSPRYIRKCISNLKGLGCLEVVKQGSNNIYILNPDITWAAGNTQRKYCKFEGTTILPAQIQEQLKDASMRLEARRKSAIKPNTISEGGN